MALEVPKAFLSRDEHRNRPPPEERLFRLPESHRKDLQDVARGIEESDVGVCCSYLVDHLSGEGADFDEHALNALERYAEQALSFEHLGELFGFAVVSSWRGRVQRCRDALAALHEKGDHRSVAVLHVAYGYPDPIASQLPELLAGGAPLASLARYADATEAKRREMIAEELRATLPTRGTRYRPGGDLRDLAEADGYDADQVADAIDMMDARERRARIDRVISSGDALRYALAPFLEPGVRARFSPGERHELYSEVRLESPAALDSRRAARKDREAAHRERREAFLTAVRVEALKMLSSAERAYHETWLRTPPRDPSLAEPPRPRAASPRGDVAPARVRGSGWSST